MSDGFIFNTNRLKPDHDNALVSDFRHHHQSTDVVLDSGAMMVYDKKKNKEHIQNILKVAHVERMIFFV